MFHPLLHLLATKPQWLAEHAAAYAELGMVELEEVAEHWRRRALFTAAAVGLTCVSVTLSGVALMFWGTQAALPPGAAWFLWGPPVFTAGSALGFVAALRRGPAAERFVDLQTQLQADLALLEEAAKS